MQLWPVAINTASYLNFSKKIVATRRYLLPKGPLPVEPVRKKRRRRTFKPVKESIVDKNLNMLPDMPSLGNTPVKNKPESETNSKENDNSTSEKPHHQQSLSFENITSFSIEFQKPDSVNQSTTGTDGKVSIVSWLICL